MTESVKSVTEIGADSPTTNDLLGFQRFVEPIAARIANASDKGTPLTIGVYGEWGSGKTSFLKMVDESLQKQDIYPIWFNAWKYDQEDNLWAALIQTILDQARVSGKWYRRIWVKLKIWRDTIDLRSGSWEMAKRLISAGLRIGVVGISLLIVFGWSASEISAFLNQIFFQWFSTNPVTLNFFQTSVIKAVAAVIAFFAAKPDELLKLFDAKLGIDYSKFKRSTSYRAHIAFLDEFSEEFKRIIKLIGSGKPLVVVIDDLDRCLPEKAVQVLEAIKLFLDVEGCIFLLAVDRDVVEKAIAVKYKDLVAVAKDADGKPQRLFTLLGENYFEKIVQLPFALPPVSDKQFKEFVTKVYPDEHIRQCSSIFTEGLPRNPRKVKRLLQTFLFLRDLAGEYIENESIRPSLIAKVVIVQNQFRSVYEDLARFPTMLGELERVYRHQENPPNGDLPHDEIEDPILREKVEAAIAQFPLLRRVLLQKVRVGDTDDTDDKDTFIGVDIEPYISLAQPIVETKGEEPSVQESSTAARGQYLRQVISATQLLNLQAIDPSAASSTALELENSFVATPLTTMEDDSKPITIGDVLKRTARSIILGVPGSGKTTLLSYLANTFAQSLLQGNASLVTLRLGISESLLPIFIPLREYGRYIEQSSSKSPTPAGFLEFLDHYFSQWNIGLSSDFFTQHLERGGCIVLLDGIDEVNPTSRQFVTQTLTSLGRRYSSARMIVTSRPAGYFPGLGEDFAHYTIANFDKDTITEFVEKWSTRFSEDPTTASRLSETFLATIFASPDLLTLAKNPLLLTTMVDLHRHQGVLPKSRVDLYENSLDMLLARWDAAKGVRTTEFRLPETKSILAALAFSAQDSEVDKLDESFVLSVFSNELAKKGASQPEAQSQAISLLEAFQERAGILIQVGPAIYQFVHLAFKEYLASIALAERENYIELVIERHGKMVWQESIVLSVARAARASSKVAEAVIHALLEIQSIESVLLAGRCALEVAPLKNEELYERIIQSLKALTTDTQIPDNLRDQVTAMVEGLSKAN